MRIKTAAIALLLAGIVLAGCTGNTTTTTSTSTTTTTSTPSTTTTTPSVTPPTTSTLPVAAPTITKVYVLSAPDRAATGGNADVCWRVEGTGTIPHTAIHHDVASHPNSTAFADYLGGARYPGGSSTPDPLGYALPGVFCTTVPVTANTYFRAHALLPTPAQSVLSDEHAVWSKAAPSGLDLVGDIPEIASGATNVTVCWQTDALGTLPHTAIHWDTVSHPNSTSFGDYVGGAVYPDNQSTPASAGYTTPGPFCTNVKMPLATAGVTALYFRAHELVPGSINNLSAEKSITIGRAVSVYHVAGTAPAGKVTVCWRDEGSGTVPHTAIHWDTVSHPSSTAFGDYAGGAIYPDNATTPASAGYALPGPYCTGVTVPASGTVYFRAHVLDPATGRNELSDEVAIKAAS